MLFNSHPERPRTQILYIISYIYFYMECSGVEGSIYEDLSTTFRITGTPVEMTEYFCT